MFVMTGLDCNEYFGSSSYANKEISTPFTIVEYNFVLGMFDGNHTLFITIQHHSTSFTRVTKRVKHGEINSVEWCCLEC